MLTQSWRQTVPNVNYTNELHILSYDKEIKVRELVAKSCCYS